jgi:lipoprotein-anchoring transpeptidase ErfK/SrfK
VLLSAVTATVVACGGGGSTAAAPVRPADPNVSEVALARTPVVQVTSTPGAATPTFTLSNPTENGSPLVFLVRENRGANLLVDLPVRPNGSTGWIRRTDVSLERNDFHVVVELNAHRITVYEGSDVFLQEPVGVGRADTPTPGGRFYVKELLRPPDPTTVYGPYVFGLSGFSNALTSFAGGQGVIGIHGNNDPRSLGRDVSHGCIRMSNDDITRLSRTLPLGTPVEIRA